MAISINGIHLPRYVPALKVLIKNFKAGTMAIAALALAASAFSANANTISSSTRSDSSDLAAPGGLVLSRPVDCRIGHECFIQQYVDHDPKDEAYKDYTCGLYSLDGNTGTHFRLPDKIAQARGVAVLAAADGVVIAIRDGEPDWSVGEFDPRKVDQKKACGNRVGIKHADGWTTDYCHLRKGSVTVKKGQTVTRGQTLGLVGQSGNTEFVHLHFEVERDGVTVDPFFVADDCSGGTVQTLWEPGLLDEMRYLDRQVINTGFAAARVQMEDIERGGIESPAATSPALVVYVRAIRLAKGDVQTLTLYSPEGVELRTYAAPPLERDKAQYMMYTGIPAGSTPWATGTYRGVYTVEAAGQIKVQRDILITFP